MSNYRISRDPLTGIYNQVPVVETQDLTRQVAQTPPAAAPKTPPGATGAPAVSPKAPVKTPVPPSKKTGTGKG